MAPSYSRSSSSLGHNPSSSTSITTLLGLLNQNGRESPPPATPLSPRPCVSRKASAARILNSHSHSDINISNNTAPSASASGSASASASATGPGHRRSLSSAVSMTSFPVVNDTDVMTTFGASHPSNTQRLPHNNNDNSNSSHRSPALTHSRGNRTLDDASAAMLTAAFQTQGFPVPRTVTATTTQSPVPAPVPAPPSTPASTSPARKARRAATIGIASPAPFNSPSSARAESVHQHVISTTTSPQSYASAIMASPTKKVVTIANQYASTQELKEWGSNFWVVITDPGTGENFFANPHTGECKWEVPPGTFVLPPNPDGQWVEFFDEQHDLPYFFHSGRKASQWERPPGFVIPLTTIQEVNMGRPFGAPAGARRTPRVSIGSDPGGAAQSALLLEDVDLSAATAADTSSSSNSNPNANGNGNGSAQGSAHARTAISPSSVVTFADEPSKKSERRKSIQPPPPAQSPSIDQVLAYRRSLSLGKNELLARALASNLIGMGAPYGTSANAAGGEAVTSILNLGEESEVLRAGGGGGVGNGSAGVSRSRNGNGNWSGHQRRRSEPIDNPPVPGTPTSVIGDLVSSPQSSPPRARASTSTAPATPNHPTQTPSSSAMAGVVRRLVLGPKLLSDEMEHIRDIPTPLSQINEDHNNNRGRGDRDRDRDRDSMNSFFNPRSHVRNSQASGTSSTGGGAGGGGGGDDTASISSAGTDFMMNLASGRLFGSTSSHQHQHSKTGSGSGAGAGAGGASGSGFTVSGPGGGASGNGYGRGGGGGGGGNGESGSIRDSITSRSSSALGGGFAPIAEENHHQQQQQQYQQTSGITVKVTRPSTSTDGASLASKSGRWTPEFGGAVSSWRRDVGWGGESSSASVSSVGVGAGAGIPASSSSSNSHSNGNGGGGSTAGGANGGGGGPPQLRERESLRNMRSPPTSGRTAAVVSAQHQQSGSGSSSQRPSSLHSHHSSQHSADSSAGNGMGFLALPQEPANHHTWDSAHTVVGRAGAGNAAGANAGAGNVSGTAAARANTWSTSTWRTNGGATSNSGAASAGKASSRRGGSGSPPRASMMWQASGNGSAGSGKSGFGRFGGGGSTTLSSSLYHSSNGGGMDETKETSYDYDSSSRSTHGVGNASPSPTPIKSPKLFSALRSKLRIATSSNASSSSHNHMHGSATGNGSSSTTTHSSSTRDRSFDSQGVMHIADRSAAAAAAKAAAGLEEEKSLPETPEEAYNRRRMHQAPPSPLSATFVGSGAGGRGGGSSRAGSGGLYTIPSRSGSLSVVGLGGGYPSPLAPSIGAVSTLGSAASPPLPQSQAQPQPQGAGGGGAVVPTSGTMAGLVRSSSTPSLGFSPNSLTTPSLDSDSSGQHDAAAVLGGSYGLGVGLPTTANGNGNGAAENNNNNNSKVPFRPSGVTDVVLNSRHTSLLASPFEADPPRNVAAADGRFRDPEVSAFDALLKGYSGSETQVLKRVKAAVVGGAESPTTTTTTGRKWF
ncbi:unnamed protein product [Tilletia caries]|uniref:WW domain-containing protein n=4 Tax=Tilletia TaxID=13289 RepID=A0ABN7JD23_9BASI|nr:unnamed protein product [Tilletia caries]CAD6960715.1 unnamed protein product [Tilletia caries]CAD7060689.1 unnamed protein product [Tilletia caries]